MTATETAPVPTEAEPYIAAVRALLWSLPADQRDELVDDLSAHLTELAAEPGAPLTERLGPPSRYAAEFVSSAGVDAALEPDARRRVRDMVTLPPALRARLAELRPAWWVLRPFVIAFGLAQAVSHSFLDGGAGPIEILVVTGIAVACVAASTRIGRERSRWDTPLTVAGVIAGIIVLGGLSSGHRFVYVDNKGPAPSSGFLTRGDGSPVTNIWAYDSAGKPVQVFLYDQLGRPIDDVANDGYDDRTGEQLVTRMPVDANGAPIGNFYPRPQQRVGGPSESSRSDPPPAVSTPRVADESTTTTSTSSTTTPSSTATTVTTAPAGPPSTP